MKLIEIDDNSASSFTNNNNYNTADDEIFLKPRVLSSLDSTMNEILTIPAISDGVKWTMYSQALQRYLNHIKFSSNKNESNRKYPDQNNSRIPEDSFNFHNPFDISGVEPVKDSLDSISQPIVRNFFERARNANITTSPSMSAANEQASSPEQPLVTKKKRSKKVRRVLPYQTRNYVSSKRRAENSLSAEVSQVRPCKVLLNRVNWEATTAR